jgi:hypothetical protein
METDFETLNEELNSASWEVLMPWDDSNDDASEEDANV